MAVNVAFNAGSTPALGRPYLGDVAFTKYIDPYTPKLFSYITAGTPLTVTLAWVTTHQATGGVVVKTVYYFNTAFLTGQAHVSDVEQPTERLSFTFKSVVMDSAYTGLSGGQMVNAESWDVGSGARCQSAKCPSWLLSP